MGAQGWTAGDSASAFRLSDANWPQRKGFCGACCMLPTAPVLHSFGSSPAGAGVRLLQTLPHVAPISPLCFHVLKRQPTSPGSTCPRSFLCDRHDLWDAAVPAGAQPHLTWGVLAFRTLESGAPCCSSSLVLAGQEGGVVLQGRRNAGLALLLPQPLRLLALLLLAQRLVLQHACPPP